MCIGSGDGHHFLLTATEIEALVLHAATDLGKQGEDPLVQWCHAKSDHAGHFHFRQVYAPESTQPLTEPLWGVKGKTAVMPPHTGF
jgi:hypothetical protein